MAIRKKRKELKRLLDGYEREADKYHEINFSVVYISGDWVSDESKLLEKNHSIPLWQYYGKVGTETDVNKLLSNIKNRNEVHGVSGAKFYSFGILEGKSKDLFLRMAKRSGNIFSEKEAYKLQNMTLKEISVSDTSSGKPVYVFNGNPVALWLNFMLFHSSISHPRHF